MVSGSGAGDIKKLSLCVVDLFQIGVIGYCFNPLLQGNNLIVASHYSHSTKFESLGKVHGGYRSFPMHGLNPVVENLEWNRSQFCRRSGTIQFRTRTDEDGDFVWKQSFLCPCLKPVAYA